MESNKKSFEHKLRVRYAETDKMGYAYYGNYSTYFEVARVEALRSVGISYRQLEDEGVMLPVLQYSIKYFKPAFYDEELTIRTTVKDVSGARIVFEYETFNEKGEQINRAETTLVFVNIAKNKPCSPPENIKEKLTPYI